MIKTAPFYVMVVYLGIKSKFVYRIGVLLNTLGVIIEFLGRIMVWLSLLASGMRFNTTLSEMVTFMVLGILLDRIVSSSAGNVIAHRIRDGSIALDFTRPIHLRNYLFFNDLGNNVFSVLAIFLPVCVVVSLGFGFLAPVSPRHLVAFMATACLGLVMRFYYSYILGLFSFWLLRNPFTSWHFRNVETLFAGVFMPIWMYPQWLATITQYLPFRYFIYEPMTFYLGKAPIESIWQVLSIQIFWLAGLFVSERLLWRKACQKLIVQGG